MYPSAIDFADPIGYMRNLIGKYGRDFGGVCIVPPSSSDGDHDDWVPPAFPLPLAGVDTSGADREPRIRMNLRNKTRGPAQAHGQQPRQKIRDSNAERLAEVLCGLDRPANQGIALPIRVDP